MYGRFVGFRNLEELKAHFPIDAANCDAAANYNVAPTQEVLAIARMDGANILDKYHWGLVPFWAKDTTIGYKMINARSESVATKPSFREAFKKRRCLILADGFYEFKGQKGKKHLCSLPGPINHPLLLPDCGKSGRTGKNRMAPIDHAPSSPGKLPAP
jgi:putative SOS response-associated peptidase YedK